MVEIYKKIIGIVAEYNPFHKGHLFHLGKARENKNDAVVVVLSSYFTQRGEPAVMSKWDRAEAALGAGVNLVLELPAFFSCHNAGIFAAGAVDILAATGMVETLSFGMEQPEFDPAPILDILVHEPSHFKDNLKKKLNSGFSYVKAGLRPWKKSTRDGGFRFAAEQYSGPLLHGEDPEKGIQYFLQTCPADGIRFS